MPQHSTAWRTSAEQAGNQYASGNCFAAARGYRQALEQAKFMLADSAVLIRTGQMGSPVTTYVRIAANLAMTLQQIGDARTAEAVALDAYKEAAKALKRPNQGKAGFIDAFKASSESFEFLFNLHHSTENIRLADGRVFGDVAQDNIDLMEAYLPQAQSIVAEIESGRLKL